MSKEECRICGYVHKCIQCDICSVKGCQKCIELHEDACSTLKKDKKHLCSVHDDFVNGYCFTCFHLVCKNCSKDMHIDHTFVSIPQAVLNIRSEILTSVNDLKKRKAQEESATTQFYQRKNDYEQKLPAFIDTEEKELQKMIADTKDSLVKQIIALNEKNLNAAKEIITQLDAAIENLKSVQGKTFPILFLSQWSNPMLVIDKHQSILKCRDSAEDINMNNNADITRMFRRLFVTHLNPEIQLMLKIAKHLPEFVAKIDKWKMQGNTVTLPCTDTPEINGFIKNIEIAYNFIIGLKNDLIQAQNDLKRNINKNADWTNRKTTDREQEKKMHMTAVNQQDKKLLSCVADEKLTKEKTAIMDLGDPNRPMRIGVKFSELYDSEWTDAMENISNVKKYYPDMMESEIQEIIMRHLHRLLKCCYRECLMKAEEQIRTLGKTLAETMFLTFKSTDEITSLPVCREASVLRRANSEGFAKFLFQDQVLCKNIIADWDYINKNENVMQIFTKSIFFEKCVYLCWCMVIQDPIMYLDDDPVSYTPIDKNTYTEFGKSGDSVAYVVWPALFLHKGGPLLYKGVVQAYWKKDENMDGV